MKQSIIKIRQWLALLLIWLTISPLFIHYAREWQLIGKRLRILLFLISPLMLIVYFPIFVLIFLFTFDEIDEYQRRNYFSDNEVIENIIGVALPELDIIDYRQYTNPNIAVVQDTDSLILKMEDELSESTFHYLDSIISIGNTEWSKHDEEYKYFIEWNHEKRTPEPLKKFIGPYGEGFFSLSFKKGSKTITLCHYILY